MSGGGHRRHVTFSAAFGKLYWERKAVVGPFLGAVRRWIEELVLMEGWNPKYSMSDQRCVLR